jgi:ADP-L-glycero-D-manno-heptose 6-epimerase
VAKRGGKFSSKSGGKSATAAGGRARAKRAASAPGRARVAAKAARRFVVTGGAGFIGSNLAAELLRREPGCHVTIVDDFSSGSWANITEACERRGVVFTGEVFAASVRDWATPWGADGFLDESKPFAVFHLAATTDTTVTDQAAMINNNAGWSWGAMLGACAEAGIRLVYASSAATYGTPPQTARREPFPLDAAGKPNNVYGFSKWLMENTHRAFVAEEAARRARMPAGFPTMSSPWIVGLRYFNVFGPGEARKGKMASMAHQLVRQCLAGTRPRLFNYGEQARDQVHVDDVVDCTLAAAGLHGGSGLSADGEHVPLREAFDSFEPVVCNLGSGQATAFNDVARAVREGLGLGAGELEVEYFEMPASVREFYQDFTQADITQTKRLLGWTPTRDPINATREYAAWMGSRKG